MYGYRKRNIITNELGNLGNESKETNRNKLSILVMNVIPWRLLLERGVGVFREGTGGVFRGPYKKIQIRVFA